MVTKILKLALSIMLLLAVSAACSQNEDNSAETSEEASSDSAESNGLSETPSQAENGEENGPARIAQSSEQRMMVYEAHIDVETNNYDQFHQHLQERMNQQDAQMVESTISKMSKADGRVISASGCLSRTLNLCLQKSKRSAVKFSPEIYPDAMLPKNTWI